MSTAGQSGAWRLVVDGEKCQGHNRCQVLAAELIEIDELGFAKAKGDGVVPAALMEKARLAVKNCPEYALRLERLEKGSDPS
jgi:ferredoxin